MHLFIIRHGECLGQCDPAYYVIQIARSHGVVKHKREPSRINSAPNKQPISSVAHCCVPLPLRTLLPTSSTMLPSTYGSICEKRGTALIVAFRELSCSSIFHVRYCRRTYLT